MLKRFKSKKNLPGLNRIIFAFRNIALFYLVFNTYNHFKVELNIFYLCITFLTAAACSYFTYKIKLRLIPAIIVLIIIPYILRAGIFLCLNIIIYFQNTPQNDLLFFYFDINFFPMLIPWALICLFNALALRFRNFIPIEIVLNVLFLILVFITEIDFHIKLMHPTVFAISIAFFILIEISILYLINKKELENKHADYKHVLTFLPLVLFVLFLVFIFVISEFNKGMVQTGGGLIGPTLFRFDFTSYITLQSEIEQSDELVMLFRKNGHAEKMLLRRFVLSGYKESEGFSQITDTSIENIQLTVPDKTTVFEDPEYLKRADVNQEYFIVNFDPNSLLGLNYPVKSTPFKNWDSSSFIRIFSVDSKISEATEENLKEITTPVMKGSLLDFYTDFSNDEKIRELALEITKNEFAYYDKVNAINDYLKNNYYYSLKPGIAEDGNQLYHFLFRNNHTINNTEEDTQMKGKGYCSYFAFAMTLMARSIGIPSRVALGFLVPPNSNILNFYEIRRYQAHAWVEVFFNDYGWIEFDPTSGLIAPGEEFQIAAGPDWQILSGLIEEILSNELIEDSRETSENDNDYSEVIAIILNSIKYIINYWYLTIPIIYILLMFLLKYYNFFAFKISKKPEDKIKHLYYYSFKMLKSCGIIKIPNESLIEFSSRIYSNKSISINGFTEVYLKTIFAESITDRDLTKANKTFKHFQKEFKKNISVFLRIIGFFNPFGVKR